MSNQYTETTSRSWFTRLGGSLKGILFGLLLFFGSFFILFWNEGNAVRTTKANEEGAANVKSLSAPVIQAENEDKLIHISGVATSSEKLRDDELKVAVPGAIRLSRKVEYYQWVEKQSSKTEKKIGGSEETATTYTYSKEWSSNYINSENFKIPEDHQNTRSASYESTSFNASMVNIGEFQLGDNLVNQIDLSERLTLSDSLSVTGALVNNNGIFFGSKNENSPQVGDVRISYTVVRPQEVSIVAKQVNNILIPYETSSGKSLALVENGNVPASKMFEMAEAQNTMVTWLLRFGGFFLMFIGLRLVFKPISVAGDVLPFLGNIMGAGISLISFIIALSLSILTIAIAWIVYRPVIGIILIAIAIGLFILMRKRVAAKKVELAGQTTDAAI